MIATVFGAIVTGVIIGALARLVLPGRQNISLLVTIILGFLGSMVGSWVTYQLGYENASGGFEWMPFFAGIAAAAVLIALYTALLGKKDR